MAGQVLSFLGEHAWLLILAVVAFFMEMGLVFEETVVLRRWGSETRQFGLSTELIMSIDHRTEIEKLD